MLNGKRIAVVMPAYNAAVTLGRTMKEVDTGVVDDIILVDDGSTDDTVAAAGLLGLRVVCHDRNKGYGANQKTCYREALAAGADVVVMLHPDYQYTPRLLVSMAGMVAYGVYDAVLASRILGRGALAGGMPLYKYVSNRVLTAVENLLVGLKLSEYHSGYRAFSGSLLRALLPVLEHNSDDFLFDNQMIIQIHAGGYRIGEISCPTRYQPESSSINLARSVVYGLGVLATAARYAMARLGVGRPVFLASLPGWGKATPPCPPGNSGVFND